MPVDWSYTPDVAPLCVPVITALHEADEFPNVVAVRWRRVAEAKYPVVVRCPSPKTADARVTALEVHWPMVVTDRDIAAVQARLAVEGIRVGLEGTIGWKRGVQPEAIDPLPDMLVHATQVSADAVRAAWQLRYPPQLRVVWRPRDPTWPPDAPARSPYVMMDEVRTFHCWRYVTPAAASGGYVVVHWPTVEAWLGTEPSDVRIATWRAWVRQCLNPKLQAFNLVALLPVPHTAYTVFAALN